MSSSSSSLPRFLTLVSQHDNATDEFNQPSCITMQIFTTPHPQIGPRHGAICFGRGNRSDEGIWSPYAKFEVVASRVGTRVHLKSSYNQKYLRRASENPNIFEIEAASDEPEEDISKWSCTLFGISDNGLTIQYNNRIWALRAEYTPSLHNGIWLRVDDNRQQPNVTKIYTRFDTVDLGMLPTLPSYVCFKADNNRYVQTIRIGVGADRVIRTVSTGTDRRELEAQFQAVPTRLRSVVLIPMAFPNTYLVRASGGDHYIASSNRNDMHYAPLEPVMLNVAGPAAVAFRSLAHPNRHFIVRRENDNAFTVSPQETGIVAQAKFSIEDTVRSRQLSNIQFLYDDMKILDPTPVAVLTKNVVNGSNVSTQETHLPFEYSDYQSNHWETTHSWQVGVSYGATATVSARLPVLKFIRAEAMVSVEVEAGYQGEHVVGETKVEESEMSTSFTLQVPPRTQSLVNMVVSKAKIQLPFTYTQREMLHDGSTVASKKVDGLYEGEATHVDYQVEEQSL